MAALGIRQPTKILQAPGDGSRWFVLQQNGLLKVFSVTSPGDIRTFLDLRDRVVFENESGLLGMAFHPDYPDVPELFVFYSAPSSPSKSVLSRFVLDDTESPGSVVEQKLVELEKSGQVHNGGDIAFGTDGYLYVAFGDGSEGGDPLDRAQDPTNFWGAMIRIDVLGVPWPSPGYRIPPDNPFAGNPICGSGENASPCPEIFAWGFRNPWRWSFDPPTGDLWLADVGQSEREEVNVVSRGGNYGWRCLEGSLPFDTSGDCPDDMIPPVAEYGHAEGDASITGGFVYRGSMIPELRGSYIFGDAVSGRIFSLARDDADGSVVRAIADTALSITTFGVDQQGELYVADNALTQRVHKIVPAGEPVPDTIPPLLSQTGCVDPANPAAVSPGLLPYSVNAEFWSDGLLKTRHLAIPDGSHIGLAGSGSRLELPPGAIAVKSFSIGGSLVETRLLMRHPDGVWAGYTYEWNDLGTDAVRVIGGKRKTIGDRTWLFPSEGQCMQCHTASAGFSLGLTLAQLNRDQAYEVTGRTANQLQTLAAVDLLDDDLPGDIDALPRLADPSDSSYSITSRARSYLDANCSQCHRPDGPTPSSLDLRADVPLSATGACNVVPSHGALGLGPDARLISVGDPSRSVLVARVQARDLRQMPPLGSTVTDTEGVQVLEDWIASLEDCDSAVVN